MKNIITILIASLSLLSLGTSSRAYWQASFSADTSGWANATASGEPPVQQEYYPIETSPPGIWPGAGGAWVSVGATSYATAPASCTFDGVMNGSFVLTWTGNNPPTTLNIKEVDSSAASAQFGENASAWTEDSLDGTLIVQSGNAPFQGFWETASAANTVYSTVPVVNGVATIPFTLGGTSGTTNNGYGQATCSGSEQIYLYGN